MHFCFQVKNVSTINGCVRLSTVSTVFTCIFKHYCLLMQRQITGTFTLFQTLFLLLFWISFFLLTQVFVLWWLSFNWEILITLLSQFPLTSIIFKTGCPVSLHCVWLFSCWLRHLCDHLRDVPWEDIFKQCFCCC